MKKVELIVKQDLFDKIGVTIGQLHYNIDKLHHIEIYPNVRKESDED